MGLPTGTISMSDVNSFLGRDPSAPVSLGDYYVRFTANQMSGTVSLSSLQGKNGGGGTVVLGYGVNKYGAYQYSLSMTGNVNGSDVSNSGVYYYDLNSFAYFQVAPEYIWGGGTYRAQIGSGSIYGGWYPDEYGNLLNLTDYPNASGTQPYNTTLTWIAVQN